jgi:hypothetical protein
MASGCDFCALAARCACCAFAARYDCCALATRFAFATSCAFDVRACCAWSMRLLNGMAETWGKGGMEWGLLKKWWWGGG